MGRKDAATCADALYALTFDGEMPHANSLRHKLFSARRFVLDEPMSAFLADLSIATFLRKNQEVIIMRDIRADRDSVLGLMMPSSRNSNKLIEQIRISARLPHPVTWIEFDFKAFAKRQSQLIRSSDSDSEHLEHLSAFTEGWLIEQHPSIETALTAHVFAFEPETTQIDLFPWQYYWMTDDQPLPWREMLNSEMTPRPDVSAPWQPGVQATKTSLSEILCGLQHYRSLQVNAWISPHFQSPPGSEGTEAARRMTEILTQWAGVIRRMWALLATINDIQVLTQDVKPSRGFVARGTYRHFLSHRTITLHVPIDRDMRKLARHVVACARRRAHMVRGHWRHDWRMPPNPLCQHEWNAADQICKKCRGHRLWIHEHQRGDPALGIVLTDYEVVH